MYTNWVQRLLYMALHKEKQAPQLNFDVHYKQKNANDLKRVKSTFFCVLDFGFYNFAGIIKFMKT